MNHFAKMCKNKKAYIRNVDVSSDYDELSDDTAQLFIGMVHIQQAYAVSSSSEQVDRWIVPIHINGTSVQCQIDTGAQANIISKQLFEKICSGVKVMKSSTKIMTFSREVLPVIGYCNLNCQHRGHHYKILFYVLNLKCQAIIGLQSSIKLNLIKKNNF
ncbi:uncharacterized protein LOC129942788 [Eupeodes corollae]|uniref:uncharacterized protein LOC129942788 n=1 Tax=Eupeodes corollae TaxID=290404 RepID=UPI00249179F0|nr:uncharacterized protein LOC129942788 [Eupeodes corollae]